MNEILKQRLVGALILIALGVVFWPIIFVEPGDTAAEEAKVIPPRPAVDTTRMPAPQATGLRQPAEIAARSEGQPTDTEPAPVEAAPEAQPPEKPASNAISPAPEVAKSNKVKPAKESKQAGTSASTRVEAPVIPKIDSDGVPEAWILQVASVSSSEKAEELRSKLLDMGYKAYVKKVHRSGGVLLRVYIGPKFEKAKLDTIQAGIDESFGVSSMIVRYVP